MQSNTQLRRVVSQQQSYSGKVLIGFFIIPLNSGIFVIFMQSQRLRIVRDSISVDMLGRFVRDQQDSRSITTSLPSCPIDG